MKLETAVGAAESADFPYMARVTEAISINAAAKYVIPAKAGIHGCSAMDPRFRGDDSSAISLPG
jgi:hypothetical protein